jgi:flagellar motor switch protein FliG
MVLTGREKATIFLSILGAETSSRILRYLPGELADLIASGINHLPTPSPDALSEVLGEFKSFLALPQSEKAATEERTLPPHRVEEKPRPRRNYALLMYERPQMIAYLLSIMPQDQREDALLNLPREKVLIEELLYTIKSNSLSPKIELKLKELYQGRLF